MEVLSRLATTIANFEMPEPYDAKVSCPVLRGFTLPDIRFKSLTKSNHLNVRQMKDRANIYGLAIGCPYVDECNDCLLKELRKLGDFEQQVEIIDKMEIAEINEITRFHQKRSFERFRFQQQDRLQKND